ncbi:MAG: hypothetical protein U0P81_11380 [Holophagaceae bacterium]
MRFLKPVLPALILLTAACRPPQIAALPQGPLRVEVHVEGLAPAFGEELKRCLEAELDPGAPRYVPGQPSNAVFVDVKTVLPDSRSSFWANWGLSTLAGVVQGGAAGSGTPASAAVGAALGGAFGIVAGPVIYARQAQLERKLGYRPLVIVGALHAGISRHDEDLAPKLTDLARLDIRPYLSSLSAEEAQDPVRIRAVTARALAQAIRAELAKHGFPRPAGPPPVR